MAHSSEKMTRKNAGQMAHRGAPGHPSLPGSSPAQNRSALTQSPPSRCRTQLSRHSACGGTASKMISDVLPMCGSSNPASECVEVGKAARIWRMTSPWVTITSGPPSPACNYNACANASGQRPWPGGRCSGWRKAGRASRQSCVRAAGAWCAGRSRCARRWPGRWWARGRSLLRMPAKLSPARRSARAWACCKAVDRQRGVGGLQDARGVQLGFAMAHQPYLYGSLHQSAVAEWLLHGIDCKILWCGQVPCCVAGLPSLPHVVWAGARPGFNATPALK